MALQGSGVITLQQIENEFGGAGAISLSEYYRGGAYVPNITQNNGVPTSGLISLSDFYGASSAFVVTVTEGTVSDGSADYYGFYGGGVASYSIAINIPATHGSRSPTTWNGHTIVGINYAFDDKSGTNRKFFFAFGGTVGVSQTIFSSLEVEGLGTLTAASATFRAATAIISGNWWRWDLGSAPTGWDGSGTRTVTINE